MDSRRSNDGDNDVEAGFPLENESMRARLGVAATAGFLGLVGAMILPMTRRRSEDDLIPAMGAMVLVTVLVATIGGFATIFSVLVSSEIRAYRSSVRVHRFPCAGRRRHVAGPADARAPGVAARDWPSPPFCALGHRRSAAGAPRPRRTARTSRSGSKTAATFWAPIRGTAAGQRHGLPAARTALSRRRRRRPMGVYGHFRAYLTTHRLRWSYPALTDDQRDWEREVARVELADLPRHLAGLGFSIVVDLRAAYADEGQRLRDVLTEAGGARLVAESMGIPGAGPAARGEDRSDRAACAVCGGPAFDAACRRAARAVPRVRLRLPAAHARSAATD